MNGEGTSEYARLDNDIYYTSIEIENHSIGWTLLQSNTSLSICMKSVLEVTVHVRRPAAWLDKHADQFREESTFLERF
jgi:hypothetical protein